MFINFFENIIWCGRRADWRVFARQNLIFSSFYKNSSFLECAKVSESGPDVLALSMKEIEQIAQFVFSESVEFKK